MAREPKQMPEFVDKLSVRVDDWFSVSAVIVVDILALISLVALVYSTWGVGLALFESIVKARGDLLYNVIIQILTVFILVEVLSVSVHFLRANRIEVRDLVDVTLAIVFREIWVGMFSGGLHWQELFALAALVVALGFMRYLMRQGAPGRGVSTVVGTDERVSAEAD